MYVERGMRVSTDGGGEMDSIAVCVPTTLPHLHMPGGTIPALANAGTMPEECAPHTGARPSFTFWTSGPATETEIFSPAKHNVPFGYFAELQRGYYDTPTGGGWKSGYSDDPEYVGLRLTRPGPFPESMIYTLLYRGDYGQ